MRKLAIVLIPLLVLTLVFGALGCGKGEVTPTPTPTPVVTPTPVPTPEPTPTPTAAPTATPTPTAAPLATPPPVDPAVPPCRFYGSVQLNGASVADGTVVTAIVEGFAYTTTTNSTPPPNGYGPSTYAILIHKPEGKSYDGKTVTFMIGNYGASQTATWSMGGNVALNISASTTP